MEPHSRRQPSWPALRHSGAVDQRGFVPAVARSRCRSGGGRADVHPRSSPQSRDHDGLGLIVAALLVVGSLPLFFGLTVVMPLLGHATWHLYRKVVEPEGSLPPTLPEERKERRYAADFPTVLFPWAK